MFTVPCKQLQMETTKGKLLELRNKDMDIFMGKYL